MGAKITKIFSKFIIFFKISSKKSIFKFFFYRKYFRFRFCDIEDGNVQKIIKKGGNESECTADFGWFTKKELHEIRQQMKIKGEQMRKLGEQPTLGQLTAS